MLLKTGNRLPSFSLIEMLVVLVLSSIVSAMLYMTFSMVFSWQTSLSKRYTSFSDRSELYFRLKKDIDRSVRVIRQDDQTLVCEQRETDDRITYSFFSDFLIRTQVNRIDTFSCKLGSPEFIYEGNPAIPGGLINELKVDFHDFQPPVTMQLFKWYDRAALPITQIDTIKHTEEP